MYTREKATKQNFIINSPSYNIIQIVAHGISEENSNNQYIKFETESILTTQEIYSLKYNKTNLIFLNNCVSGFGTYIPGEGSISLNRAFMYSGIPNIVSSLWLIDSEYMYKFSNLFFKNYTYYKKADVALRYTKLELLKDAPFYWSGIVTY